MWNNNCTLYSALPTCKLTEIEVSNSVYCMVMVKFSNTKKNSMGVSNFMEGSLISYDMKGPHFHLTPALFAMKDGTIDNIYARGRQSR